MFRTRDSVARRARLVAREWREDRVGGLAAEIAFFALLGFFPLLLAVAAALGWLEVIAGGEVAAKAQATVLAFLDQILSDDAAGTVEAVRRLFTEASPGVLTIGTALAVWAASRSFAAVIDALDVAYDVEERRSWSQRRLLAVGLAGGTVVVFAFVLAALVLGPLLGTGREVAGLVGGGDAFAMVWDWVRWPALLLALVCWAATVLHLAPNRDGRTPWRAELPGAILTTGLWVAASLALRLYLAVAGDTNEVFGLLGGVLIVVVWLYLLALGLLVGGELNGILAHERCGRPGRPSRFPSGRPGGSRTGLFPRKARTSHLPGNDRVTKEPWESERLR